MADTSTPHTTFRRLLDLHDGVLSGARQRAAEEHLSEGCPACTQELEDIGRLTGRLASGRLPAPPRALVRGAKRLFRRARLRSALAGIERVVARLVLDQRVQPVPALRSTPGAGRRLLWNVGEVELFVTLRRDGPNWSLRGEFLPVEDDDASNVEGDVALVGPFGPTAATELDAAGCFAFRDVGPARYEIEAVVNGTHVLVPAFVIE